MRDSPSTYRQSRRSWLTTCVALGVPGCIGTNSPSDDKTGAASGTQSDGPTRWKTEMDAEPTHPVAGHLVYVGAGSHVHAFEHSGGEEVWAKSIPGPVRDLKTGRETLYVISEVTSSPRLLGPEIRITALDTTTGEQRWDAEWGKRRVFASGNSRLFLTDQTDVVPANVDVSAVDGRDGSVHWTRNMAYPQKAVASDNRLFIAAHDGIYAIEATSGEQQWHYGWEEFGNQSFVIGGAIVAGVEGSFSEGLTLHMLNRDGTHRWSFDDWQPLGITAHDDQLFVGGERFGALSATTGEVEWSVGRRGGIYHALIRSGLILVGGDDVRAYAVGDGTEQWRYKAKPSDLSPSVVLDETAYILGAPTVDDAPRHVFGLDLNTGDVQWQMEADSNLTAITGSNHGGYVSAESGLVYALS